MAHALLPSTGLSSSASCQHRRSHTHAPLPLAALAPQRPSAICSTDAAPPGLDAPTAATSRARQLLARRRRRAVSAHAAPPADGPGANHHHHHHGSSHEDGDLVPRGAPHENGTGAHGGGLSASPAGPYRNLSPTTLNNISVFSLPSTQQQPQRVPEPALVATASGPGGGGGGVGRSSTAGGPQGARAEEGGGAAPDGGAAAGSLDEQRRRGEQGGASGVPDAFTPGKEGEARRGIFNRVSRHYDELNNVLSLGQHWIWKSMAVKWSGAKAGQRVLDVCCGSGDLALLLSEVVGPKGKVVGLDFAERMLADARAKQQLHQQDVPAYRRPLLEWVQGDAMALPFPDEQFDAATMGYGLRNVADIPRALGELHRVLKPGCTVAVLDFNNSTDPVVDQVQALALDLVVVPSARFYGLEDEYKYLRPSIKRFPSGEEQERLALAAGFAKARHYAVGFGLMGVLVATKGGGPKPPGVWTWKE